MMVPDRALELIFGHRNQLEKDTSRYNQFYADLLVGPYINTMYVSPLQESFEDACTVAVVNRLYLMVAHWRLRSTNA